MDPLTHRFFWLHIKKSGGTSARAMFGPAYVQSDRSCFPCCFTGRPRPEWNDILNNYRIPIGHHQFRRSLYARDFLYPEWDSMLRLAFVREPVSRCVSMFHYLHTPRAGLMGLVRSSVQAFRQEGARFLTERGAFDAFLRLLERRFAEPMPRVDAPRSLHFTTHTARMWEDVTDREGRVLINRIWRLEHLDAAIASALEEIGLDPGSVPRPREARLNASKAKSGAYRPDAAQRARIERLYARDFDLYENGLRS